MANSTKSKSEVNRYLVESCEEVEPTFDLLNWWKVDSVNYSILSKTAHDIIAILVSTMASEYIFNMVGRVFNYFQSSLSPIMEDDLICVQN